GNTPSKRLPTAQMSVEEITVTACRRAPPGMVGLETRLQLTPSQCSITGLLPIPEPTNAELSPPAQTSVADTPATPLNAAVLIVGTVGLRTTLQEEPSQRSTSGWFISEETFAAPTAQAVFVPGTAATPLR